MPLNKKSAGLPGGNHVKYCQSRFTVLTSHSRSIESQPIKIVACRMRIALIPLTSGVAALRHGWATVEDFPEPSGPGTLKDSSRASSIPISSAAYGRAVQAWLQSDLLVINANHLPQRVLKLSR
jgi:hypothetical protein